MLPGAAFKVYVNVFVEHTTEGLMLPRTIVWEDGLKYDIDRVIDIRPAYAAKAGGQGDRYTVLDCALREFADHDAFVSFIFEMVDIF